MNHPKIEIATDSESIAECFTAFKELLPHLSDVATFQKTIIKLIHEGYTIAYIKEEEVVACIGYRLFEMLEWRKVLYIEDLITKASSRGKGYGSALLSHAIDEAKRKGCDEVHLDTGYERYDAHRAYLKHGFQLNCHHLSLKLT
ncbi:MAG: GNAT family N-acetyltransferase [Caedimonadaceae bacterium]|nr:MAG: GNAT family N-acetyltransferase [Caedimonadaceae bacterium]